MRLSPVLLAVAALLACDSGNDPASPPLTDLDLQLVPVVTSGLRNPVYLTSPPNDARQFIVEKEGRIRVVKNGALLPTPFLDISGDVNDDGERGLLSLAFHPQYATNGYFYVHYTATDGRTRIHRYSVSPTNPDLAGGLPTEIFVSAPRSATNHNGGLNLFGPDGKLYVSIGDAANRSNAQDLSNPYGKILRFDVDLPAPYTPADNPYVGQAGRVSAIWAHGLRNPWRFTFDATTSRMYIADVGDNQTTGREEINALGLTSSKGANFGWPIMEGTTCSGGGTTCDRTGLTLPVFEYVTSSARCAIIGGSVYRGSAIPELVGYYVFGDYCSKPIRAFRYSGTTVTDVMEWPLSGVGNTVSFGTDGQNNLYLLATDGVVYRVVKGTGA